MSMIYLITRECFFPKKKTKKTDIFRCELRKRKWQRNVCLQAMCALWRPFPQLLLTRRHFVTTNRWNGFAWAHGRCNEGRKIINDLEWKIVSTENRQRNIRPLWESSSGSGTTGKAPRFGVRLSTVSCDLRCLSFGGTENYTKNREKSNPPARTSRNTQCNAFQKPFHVVVTQITHIAVKEWRLTNGLVSPLKRDWLRENYNFFKSVFIKRRKQLIVSSCINQQV